MLAGNVLITGGAGFLGRAILRRAQREHWPARFTVYSRDEEKQHIVRDRYPETRCILGDVLNFDRLALAMAGHQTVIHASAVKFVPEAEYNVGETIDVNVRGSVNVAMAAHASGVDTVIGVSTDKACMPVNTYGATKMLMERYFAEANHWQGRTRFSIVRYGNVVGSTGSIVPVFRRQLEQDGRVRVTDPEMTRFWLSPDDAVELIADAAMYASADPGCVIVPLLGAMKIGELAQVIAGEAPVDVIGARPGEKKHEHLISEHEAARCLLTSVCGRTRVAIFPPSHPTLANPPSSIPLKVTDGYTSERPGHWYDYGEMAAIIGDAETI